MYQLQVYSSNTFRHGRDPTRDEPISLSRVTELSAVAHRSEFPVRRKGTRRERKSGCDPSCDQHDRMTQKNGPFGPFHRPPPTPPGAESVEHHDVNDDDHATNQQTKKKERCDFTIIHISDSRNVTAAVPAGSDNITSSPRQSSIFEYTHHHHHKYLFRVRPSGICTRISLFICHRTQSQCFLSRRGVFEPGTSADEYDE